MGKHKRKYLVKRGSVLGLWRNKRKRANADGTEYDRDQASSEIRSNELTSTDGEMAGADDNENDNINQTSSEIPTNELASTDSEMAGGDDNENDNTNQTSAEIRTNELTSTDGEMAVAHGNENTMDFELLIDADNTKPDCPEKHVGRRIINVTHFFNKLKEVAQHGPLGCGMNALEIVSEKQKGLSSYFTVKCRMCNLNFYIESDCEEDNYVDINTCAVAGTIAIGAGHAQLEEFLAAVNLPLITDKIYQQTHENVSNIWKKVALELMEKAGKKERELAIAEGRVTKNGIPIIDVIVDGCWAKRSYKKNYSSLSGAAAVIGKITGEVLYLGVRNKYCYTCDRAEKQNVTVKEHVCFKNYAGPSTGMESDIIVEAFKNSIEMHGVIYGRFISDGDSSTYAKIIQSRPYPDYTVEKVECRNHVLRNFCNKLQALQTDTKYPVKTRKLLTKIRILTIRSIICKAIKKNKDSECPEVQHLFEDILLAHHHSFGNHSKCKAYFCKKIGQNEEVPQDFYVSTLWQKICFLMTNIAAHARSLIHDVDSNAVERYHSIVAKLVGGKRINYCLKNSYQTRCVAAVVSFNTKKALSRLYKDVTHSSPKGKLKMLENRRLKTMTLNRNYKKIKTRTLFKKQDKNYGEECVKPDMEEAVFNLSKDRFMKDLKKTDEMRAPIEKNTILQADCSEWLELRRSLLTASNFGRIIKKRPDTRCANIVRDMLYKTNIDHVASIKHGRENEKVALNQLAIQENITIRPCGLFIDSELQFLGATPDGLVGDDTIVEVKYPITANRLGLDEAIKQKKLNFWTQSKQGTIEINKNNNWYFQIQGQLHITKRQKCLFAVWTKEKIKTELIFRDDLLWDRIMKPKLVSFYMDCMLPELVDPRFTRSLPIRELQTVEKSIRKKKDKEKPS